MVPLPKKCVTHAKGKCPKTKGKRASQGVSDPSSQVSAASQSQVQLTQASQVDQECVEHMYEFESDDDSFLYFVCGTMQRSLRAAFCESSRNGTSDHTSGIRPSAHPHQTPSSSDPRGQSEYRRQSIRRSHHRIQIHMCVPRIPDPPEKAV